VYAHIKKKAAELGLDPAHVEAIYRQIVNMCSAVQELKEKSER
jgi:chorismate mutase